MLDPLAGVVHHLDGLGAFRGLRIGRLLRRPLGGEEEVGQVAGERPEDADADDDDRRSQDPALGRHGVLVAVADGGDRHDDVPDGVGGRGDVGVRGRLLQREHPQAAELEDQDSHEQQAQQGAAGPVAQQPVADEPPTARPEQLGHAHQAEDPEDLHLGEGQARQEIGPAELAEEVAGPGRRGRQPVEEVDEEDGGQQDVHDEQHGVEALVGHHVHQQEVEDRQDRDGRHEELVADVLQLVPLAAPGHPRRTAAGHLLLDHGAMLAAPGLVGITPSGWTTPAVSRRQRSASQRPARARRPPSRSGAARRRRRASRRPPAIGPTAVPARHPPRRGPRHGTSRSATRAVASGCAWRFSHHAGSPAPHPFMARVTQFGPSCRYPRMTLRGSPVRRPVVVSRRVPQLVPPRGPQADVTTGHPVQAAVDPPGEADEPARRQAGRAHWRHLVVHRHLLLLHPPTRGAAAPATGEARRSGDDRCAVR